MRTNVLVMNEQAKYRFKLLIIVMLIFSFGLLYKRLVAGVAFHSLKFTGDDSESFERHSLDAQCSPMISTIDKSIREIMFENISISRAWTSDSRSGPGSTIRGAFNWIEHLRTFIRYHRIRSVADIPCGDTYWQFAIREMNTLPSLYFGGDISRTTIKENQIWYAGHLNKIFALWDIVECPLPTYSTRNGSNHVKNQSFDLVIMRDAIMHMNVHNGLKAVKNVVSSNARYFALSSYPANCTSTNFCIQGNIVDGGFYENNINCHPFNFPLSKPLVIQKSHIQFPDGADEMHVYPIDPDLKSIVSKYNQAC